MQTRFVNVNLISNKHPLYQELSKLLAKVKLLIEAQNYLETIKTAMPIYLKYKDILSEGSKRNMRIPKDEYSEMLNWFVWINIKLLETLFNVFQNKQANDYSAVFEPLSINYDLIKSNIRFTYIEILYKFDRFNGRAKYLKFYANQFELINNTADTDHHKSASIHILAIHVRYISLKMMMNIQDEQNAFEGSLAALDTQNTQSCLNYLIVQFIKKPFDEKNFHWSTQACPQLQNCVEELKIYNNKKHNQNYAFTEFIKQIQGMKNSAEEELRTTQYDCIQVQKSQLNSKDIEYYSQAISLRLGANYSFKSLLKMTDEELLAGKILIKSAIRALENISVEFFQSNTYSVQTQVVDCLKQYILLCCHKKTINPLTVVDKYSLNLKYKHPLSFKNTFEEYLLQNIFFLLLNRIDSNFDLKKIKQVIKDLVRELLITNTTTETVISRFIYAPIIEILEDSFKLTETFLDILFQADLAVNSQDADQSQLTMLDNALEDITPNCGSCYLQEEVYLMRLALSQKISTLNGMDLNSKICRDSIRYYLKEAYKSNALEFAQDTRIYQLLNRYNLHHYDYNDKLNTIKEQIIKFIRGYNPKKIGILDFNEKLFILYKLFLKASLPNIDPDLSIKDPIKNINQLAIFLLFSFSVMTEKVSNIYDSKMECYFTHVLSEFVDILVATNSCIIQEDALQKMRYFFIKQRVATIKKILFEEKSDTNQLRNDEIIVYCLMYVSHENRQKPPSELIKIYSLLFEAYAQQKDYKNAIKYIDMALEKSDNKEPLYRLKTMTCATLFKETITNKLDQIYTNTIAELSLLEEIKASEVFLQFNSITIGSSKQNDSFLLAQQSKLRMAYGQMQNAHRLLLNSMRSYYKDIFQSPYLSYLNLRDKLDTMTSVNLGLNDYIEINALFTLCQSNTENINLVERLKLQYKIFTQVSKKFAELCMQFEITKNKRQSCNQQLTILQTKVEEAEKIHAAALKTELHARKEARKAEQFFAEAIQTEIQMQMDYATEQYLESKSEEALQEEEMKVIIALNKLNEIKSRENISGTQLNEAKKSEENLSLLVAVLEGKGSEIQLNDFAYFYNLEQELDCKIVLKGSLVTRLAILHFSKNPTLASSFPIAEDIDASISCNYDNYKNIQTKLEALGFLNIKSNEHYANFKKNMDTIIYDLTIETPHYKSHPFMPLQLCTGTFIKLTEEEYDAAKAENLPIVKIDPYYIKLSIKEGYEQSFINACLFKEFLVKKPAKIYSSYCYNLFKYRVKISHCASAINLDNKISNDESFIPYNAVFTALRWHFLDLFKEECTEPYDEMLKFIHKGFPAGTEKYARPFISAFFSALILLDCNEKIEEENLEIYSNICAMKFINVQTNFKSIDKENLIRLINAIFASSFSQNQTVNTAVRFFSQQAEGAANNYSQMPRL